MCSLFAFSFLPLEFDLMKSYTHAQGVSSSKNGKLCIRHQFHVHFCSRCYYRLKHIVIFEILPFMESLTFLLLYIDCILKRRQ